MLLPHDNTWKPGCSFSDLCKPGDLITCARFKRTLILKIKIKSTSHIYSVVLPCYFRAKIYYQCSFHYFLIHSQCGIFFVTVNNTPARSWIRPLILTIHLTKITSTEINEYELELEWTENTTIRKNSIK